MTRARAPTSSVSSMSSSTMSPVDAVRISSDRSVYQAAAAAAVGEPSSGLLPPLPEAPAAGGGVGLRSGLDAVCFSQVCVGVKFSLGQDQGYIR